MVKYGREMFTFDPLPKLAGLRLYALRVLSGTFVCNIEYKYLDMLRLIGDERYICCFRRFYRVSSITG